jgi:RHS repeat-associated protein
MAGNFLHSFMRTGFTVKPHRLFLISSRTKNPALLYKSLVLYVIIFAILVLCGLIFPAYAQDDNSERWQTVDRWVGTIRYEIYGGPDVPVSGVPGSAHTVVTYDLTLDREDDRTWRGRATGAGSYEAQAERQMDNGIHTVNIAGEGTLENEAYLRMNYREGTYTLGITGRPEIVVHYRELMIIHGTAFKDVDRQIDLKLARVSSRSVDFPTPELPSEGFILSGDAESSIMFENHIMSWVLQPEGDAPVLAEEDDFSCIVAGSFIHCQEQALSYSEEVVGTPFSLNYHSGRIPSECRETPWNVKIMNFGGWTLSIHHFLDTSEEHLYLGTGHRRKVTLRKDANVLFPGYLVASSDGLEVYHFDEEGRHTRTLHALTGGVLYSLQYEEDRLVRIDDIHGGRTTIDRSSDGAPSAIRGPYGQVTRLLLNDMGFIRTILKPGGESIRFMYNENGLLTSKWDANGNLSSYAYDDCGRLTVSKDAAGGSWRLNRSEARQGYQVAATTASGRTTTYIVENQTSTSGSWLNTFPEGAQNRMTFNKTDYREIDLHNGNRMEISKNPDPRFDMQAPVKSTYITDPDGMQFVIERERDAVLANASNPFSLVTLTETLSVNGRIYSDVYDAASRTFTRTLPSGRQIVATLNEAGQVVSYRESGLAPVKFRYNGSRLKEVSQGERTLKLDYDAQGNPEAITDPLNRKIKLHYNLSGRIESLRMPDDAVTAYEYDPSGNITGITPPGKSKHSFAYNAVHQLQQYNNPGTGSGIPAVEYRYNTDRELISIQNPDARPVTLEYSTSGKLTGISHNKGDISISYNNRGNTEMVTSPYGLIRLRYKGNALSMKSWSGRVAGDVSFSYDSYFLLSGMAVNERSWIQYMYDDDGQITLAGSMDIKRCDVTGFVKKVILGNIVEQRKYNQYGELTSLEYLHDDIIIKGIEVKRDLAGRIVVSTVTTGSEKNEYRYKYDLVDRLEEVILNNERNAAYEYDANGNRIACETSSGKVNAVYDEQDRLISRGSGSYNYGTCGQLTARMEEGKITSYEYDGLGNLLKVVLPDGERVEYLVDGYNRRIGKELNGKLVKGFLYMDSLNPVAELDGNNNVRSIFVYGTKTNVPEYMENDGGVYRLITDHLGSVRMVVDIHSGEIAQQIGYDAFGQIISDTNPGFQPFGFAGGLYDEHTGLVRFGAREYDPEAGRWTARDPILFDGGDTNLYAYVGNDPVNWMDMYGLSANLPSVPSNGANIWTVRQARSLIYSETRRFSRPVTDLQYGQEVEEISTCEETPGWLKVRYINEHTGQTFEGYMPVHDFMPGNILQPGQAPARQGTGRGGTIGSASRG